MIKVLKKGQPVFVTEMYVKDLDKTKCSAKFLANMLRDDEVVYVKCLENGEIDFRGKAGEYRIMPITTKVLEESQMLKDLRKYFDETPKEKIQADWDAAGKATEGINSPTVKELLANMENQTNQKEKYSKLLATINIKKGDWVRKKNYDTIGKHICVQIKGLYILPMKVQGPTLVINGFCQATEANLVVVSEEEAKRLNDLSDSMSLSPNEHDEITSCIREDNGEPKMKFFNEQVVLKKLFMLSMQHPEKHLQAYKCIRCGAHHLGKSKLAKEENESIRP